jgi:hypothetical protein
MPVMGDGARTVFRACPVRCAGQEADDIGLPTHSCAVLPLCHPTLYQKMTDHCVGYRIRIFISMLAVTGIIAFRPFFSGLILMH